MEKGSNGFLFGGWHDWLSYVENAFVGLVKGFCRMLYAIVMGLVSILVYLFNQIKRIVIAYPVPTLAILCVFLVFLALFLFVNFSAKLKSCQMERDSVAYEKMKLEQAFIGDTIVIRGHSTRKEKAELIE